MKTSEFIEYFQNEFCYVKEFSDGIFITDIDDLDLFYLCKNKNSFSTIKFGFESLDFSKQQEYYKVIFEYLMTPPEEREKEKKYYLRQIGINEYDNFLNLEYETQSYYVSSNEEFYDYKTKFTQSEIDEMPECYKHPAVWEKIKVEREEQ